ncbi:glutathione synthase [Sanyastnella coralliicola]|uniref:glutathione synthase n=1 Tax=Sanyastnella coralliicola TaxID=3069118 RepID=UPI0027BA5631|nr:glutathione synthase [Longitalea sp. SCSIO 12813]
MNYLFIMYPWEDIDPNADSSLQLIHEVASRGYKVALTTAANLTIRDCMAMTFAKVLKNQDKVSKSVNSFYKNAQFKEEMLPLAGFDVIFMRANPPLDNIVLNFLDSVKDDVFIINDVEGLREANNKLYTAAFYDPKNEVIPATHVSKNKEYLKRVIKESDSEKMIMKPLNGYGGSGVIVLEKGASSNMNSLLDFYISRKDGESNYVILQDYVEGAELGDIRVLMLHGEPIGAMRRVPAEGDARSNVAAGGSIQKHTLTAAEKKLCKWVGPKLVQDGLYFAGLDLIGGKLIEVNVLSPGGINYINKLNKVKLQRKIIDYCDDVIRSRESLRSRRSELRKAVENA